MGVDWNNYRKEKEQIKLKYLELLKERFRGKQFNLREEVTNWALGEFPELKIPKKQFAGTFDHSGWGFFIKDHNFLVTQKDVKVKAASKGTSPIKYIDELIKIVQGDNKMGLG